MKKTAHLMAVEKRKTPQDCGLKKERGRELRHAELFALNEKESKQKGKEREHKDKPSTY